MIAMKVIKNKEKVNNSKLKSYAFWFLNRKWIVSISDKKWHKGDKFTRMPIWFSTVRDEIKAIFIWNIMIGVQKKTS